MTNAESGMVMKIERIWCFLFAIGASLGLALGGYAQSSKGPIIIEPNESVSCPFSSATIDALFQNIDKEDNLVVISFSRKGESRALALQRLTAVRKFLVGYSKYRTADSMIEAIGTKPSLVGKVDFFLNGVLRLSIRFRLRHNLRLQPCYQSRTGRL